LWLVCSALVVGSQSKLKYASRKGHVRNVADGLGDGTAAEAVVLPGKRGRKGRGWGEGGQRMMVVWWLICSARKSERWWYTDPD